MSQLWDDTHTLNLENCLVYLLSTISQFFDFVRCIVFDFIFYCVTAHTLYSDSLALAFVSRAFRELHVITLRFDWLTVFSMSFVRGNSFGFGR